jgi:periplasmic divalent cation tolerance protein
MVPDREVVVVRTTVEDRAEATRMANAVVAQRLAACVQIVPIRSVYRWNGAIETASEYLLLAKTRASLAEALCAAIRAGHGYELPEIVVTPVTGGSEDYLQWVYSETGTAP